MAAQPTAEAQERLVTAQRSTEDSIAWWTNVMILVSAGLLLLSFAPDSLVVSDNAETEMPFIGSASIQLVLISGPLVLILIRMLLSSFLSHWNRLEREIGQLETEQDFTLSIMRNQRLNRWAGFVHFPLVAIVFIATTAKGLAFPLWGEIMTLLTIVVTLWLTYRAARNGRWFNLAMLLAIIIVAPLAFYYQLMEPVPPRLDEGFAQGRLMQDADEDSYRGSLFWVGCSSPAVDRKVSEGDGCIGTRGDWNLEPENEPDDDLRGRIRTLLSYANRFYVFQRRIDLSGAEMTRADLRYLNLQWASLTHANLADSLLRYGRLQHATFMDARLRGANLGRAVAWDASFRRADLQDARFWQSQFQDTDFRGADLTGARVLNSDFTGAELTRAVLTGADLRSTKLDGAILENTRFEGTRFGAVGERRETSLKCARLEGVDLRQTRDLTQSMLKGACVNADTRVPEPLTLPEHPCRCGENT